MILVLFKYNCLHDCLQAVENHYNDFAKRDSSTTFEFEKNEINLNIPEDGELTKEGWSITPNTPTVVCLYNYWYSGIGTVVAVAALATTLFSS